MTVKVDGTPLAFDYWQDDHGAWIAHARHERTALTLSGSPTVAVESLSLRKVKNVSDYQLPTSK